MPTSPQKRHQSAQAAAPAASSSSSLSEIMDENILANISLQLSKQGFGFFGQVNSSINKTLKDRTYITDAITQIREQNVPFTCLSKALQSDREVIEAALQFDGLNLQFLPEPLKNDPDLIRIAVAQNGGASLFISDASRAALDLPDDPVAKQLF